MMRAWRQTSTHATALIFRHSASSSRPLTVAGFALLPKVPVMSAEEGWIQLTDVQDIVATEAHNLITKIQDDESLNIERRIELVRTVIELQTRLRRALRISQQAGARLDSSA
jgi:hypothetical protein